jgi:predicted homoserine dehydrogenase-like protein
MISNSINNDIRIGLIGVGFIGKGILYQTIITENIKTVAVCDINIERACKILNEFKLDYEIIDNSTNLKQIVAEGKVAVFKDGVDLAGMDGIDAVVEATGTIIPGGQHSIKALETGKNLVLMNSEADLIFGPYLSYLAAQHNVVFTSADGDQYGVLKHLIDDLKFWGLKFVMAGNIKGFLNLYANPTSIIDQADKRKLNYRACTSYTDGTKINIEMALIANALGLVTKIPGMYGIACENVDEVLDVFDFNNLFLDKKPFVDYIIGANPGGGVFAVGYCENPYQMEMLKYYKMGNGPFYNFYRPHHLPHIEIMSSIFQAVNEKKALLKPEFGFVTNVYAYTKKDLKAGDMLDGIGGYTCYGQIENCDEQDDLPGIPICLADKVLLKKDINKDMKICIKDVDFDPNRFDFKLFAMASEKRRQDGK